MTTLDSAVRIPTAVLTDAATAIDTATAVDVVIPVFNEEADLERSVRRLHVYLRDDFPFSARITIADNASTDRTWAVACRLAEDLPGVRAITLAEKGRGRALREAWGGSDAPVLVYMDVDLSTDLTALLPLVAPLMSGHSDVAIGTRLSRGARVVRGPKRELISRGYNLILHAALGTRFSDAQCGFKAIRSDRARELLPLIEDTGWFFDTELLVLAERAGLRIHEVPVDWVDDADSRVDIVSTALDDLRGVARLVRSGWRSPRSRATEGIARQVARFTCIGVASTLAYLLLYLGLRQAMPALAANALALLATAIANTAANRRITFGLTGSDGVLRQQAQGLGVFALALALTSLSLAALRLVTAHPTRGVEVTVLVVANLAATVARFVLLRGWVFRAHTQRSFS